MTVSICHNLMLEPVLHAKENVGVYLGQVTSLCQALILSPANWEGDEGFMSKQTSIPQSNARHASGHDFVISQGEERLLSPFGKIIFTFFSVLSVLD